jgi:site-specific DNA recombinase
MPPTTKHPKYPLLEHAKALQIDRSRRENSKSRSLDSPAIAQQPRAAVYARYSTEHQSAASIEDQFRVCDRLAKRNGFRVVARFEDAGISGGTTQRPGYQSLLTAARAREFDVIIAEDTSRLWRQQAEQWRAIAELSDLGIHIVTQDADTRSENYKLLLSMHGAMADLYRDQIAYRTKRGLEGRAQSGKSTGGRAYGYIAARDSGTGDREIHLEQAGIVRRIFEWYAAGKSPRWIAGELNRLGVPSPGASWNRTSERLNAKRRRGWVSTAIHGDRKRGTGILNNRSYIGEFVWGRSTWKRSATDSKIRRWQPAAEPEAVVRHRDERLRIIDQGLWNAVKTRQREIEATSSKLREGLKRKGRLPRHLLSGLLTCAECGGTFRCVNGREYGCATHKDGGEGACPNELRVSISLAEQKLLGKLTEEMLSPEGLAVVERLLREHLRQPGRPQKEPPKAQAAQLARKDAEMAELRGLMRAGKLSAAAAQAAITMLEREREELVRTAPNDPEKQTARILRVLPRSADLLRQRISGGNLGLRDPQSILQARMALFDMFGGRVALRRARGAAPPFLIARVGINRAVLLAAAAGAAGCVESGSGGRI